MENPKNNVPKVAHQLIKILLKILIAFIIIFIIFMFGLGMGLMASNFKGNQGMMYYNSNYQYGEKNNGEKSYWNMPMMNGWYTGCQKYGKNTTNNEVQLFGVIDKVQGDQIIIVDNGANSRVVVSSATTVIMTKDGQIGIGMLKAGQAITAQGRFNENKELIATFVKVN